MSQSSEQHGNTMPPPSFGQFSSSQFSINRRRGTVLPPSQRVDSGDDEIQPPPPTIKTGPSPNAWHNAWHPHLHSQSVSPRHMEVMPFSQQLSQEEPYTRALGTTSLMQPPQPVNHSAFLERGETFVSRKSDNLVVDGATSLAGSSAMIETENISTGGDNSQFVHRGKIVPVKNKSGIVVVPQARHRTSKQMFAMARSTNHNHHRNSNVKTLDRTESFRSYASQRSALSHASTAAEFEFHGITTTTTKTTTVSLARSSSRRSVLSRSHSQGRSLTPPNLMRLTTPSSVKCPSIRSLEDPVGAELLRQQSSQIMGGSSSFMDFDNSFQEEGPGWDEEDQENQGGAQRGAQLVYFEDSCAPDKFVAPNNNGDLITDLLEDENDDEESEGEDDGDSTKALPPPPSSSKKPRHHETFPQHNVGGHGQWHPHPGASFTMFH